MTCPKCSKNIESNIKFCPYCGEEIGEKKILRKNKFPVAVIFLMIAVLITDMGIKYFALREVADFAVDITDRFFSGDDFVEESFQEKYTDDSFLDEHDEHKSVLDKIERELTEKSRFIITTEGGKEIISNEHIKTFYPSVDPVESTSILIIELNEEGTQLFADATSESIARSLNVYIDSNLILEPVVTSPITDGILSLSGLETDEVAQLNKLLNKIAEN